MAEIDLTMQRISRALIAYNARQMTKPGWNPAALSLYFDELDAIRDAIVAGETVREAILGSYTGRLATAVLKAVGERAITVEEAHHR